MDTRVNRFVSKEFLSITNSYTLTELIMHKWCTLWSCESSVKNAVNLVALFCFAIWYLSTHQTFLKPAKFNKTFLKQTLSVQNKMGLALFFFFFFWILLKFCDFFHFSFSSNMNLWQSPEVALTPHPSFFLT